MIRYVISLAVFLWVSTPAFSQWKPAGKRIKTVWAEKIDVGRVLPEYPRPIMKRAAWQNLNGLWDYAITPAGSPSPGRYDGEILVPFAVESSLSGVGKPLGEKNELWYRRTFTVPAAWGKQKVLLHFGAVDWRTDVWVNNVKVGVHEGGFTPFSFDITPAMKKGVNELTVRVWDPTDKGPQPRGKQVSQPGGIWYTPVSGIWQTVWLEPVPRRYITDIRTTPDIDKQVIKVKVNKNEDRCSDRVEVKVFDGEHPVASGASVNGMPVEVPMPADAKRWSPDAPFLYKMEISLLADGKVVDRVESYTAMRKFSTRRDDNGIVRLQLNNEDLFQFGPLDQGWWPDGLYTAPSDEALAYDIRKTKELGFNMIRKHIKVEPARWYAHCDSIGLIVWQDMPSGDKNPEWQSRQYFDGVERQRSAGSEATYRREWKEIIDCLYSYPCIGTWVPFNEAWGQFKTAEIAGWTKQYDPSRLVNAASGGNHYPCGDMLDLHHYPEPRMFLYDAARATVLGEYGGIGLVVKPHVWEPARNWGYVQFATSAEATRKYVEYAKMLKEMISRGFSAAVYTQTTDVEVEVNGLMTYDRKVVKMDEKKLQQVNGEICRSLEKRERRQ